MRTYDNGSGFTVSYNENDADNFSAQFPNSTVQGRGAFGFQNNGDLIELTGSAARGEFENNDWIAFAEECKAYGAKRITTIRKRNKQP